MDNITIKDSTGTDVVFKVVRQPSGTQSAILTAVVAGAGMNRSAFPKIEVSTRIQNGATSPVVSVVVPYGTVQNEAFKKLGQVATTTQSRQPADAPSRAMADAAAFQKNLMANTAIQDLLNSGNL